MVNFKKRFVEHHFWMVVISAFIGGIIVLVTWDLGLKSFAYHIFTICSVAFYLFAASFNFEKFVENIKKKCTFLNFLVEQDPVR